MKILRHHTSRILASAAFVAFLSGFALFTACRSTHSKASFGSGDTVTMKYARLLTIVKHAGYTVVTVANPWKEGQTLHTYILVDRHRTLPAHLPKGTVVRTPLQRNVVFTTVHCSLMMALEQQKSIVGVTELRYIKIPWIQEQARKGVIADCGEGMNPAIERIIHLHPEALLLSPFENSGGYGKLEDLGVPLIECADYMESSPLGRAEWMKFYGMLTGAEAKADSLFAVVDSTYNALTGSVAHRSDRPSVLMDKMMGTVWYVPGGESTIGRLITDAGGNYVFRNERRSGSISMPFESILAKAGTADIWLFRYDNDRPMTYPQLRSEYAGYDRLAAFRNRKVYACNVRQTLFYEETPFRPDRLLRNMISIFHPGALPTASNDYYLPLNS